MRHAGAALLALLAGCSQAPEPAPPQQAPPPAPLDRTVANVLALGQSLKLSACPTGKLPADPCVAEMQIAAATVRLPGLDPDIYSTEADVRLLDGQIVRVTLTSSTRAGADRDLLAALVAKYGDPAQSGRDDRLSQWARWTGPDIDVAWFGAGADLDRGIAIIETDAGRQLAEAERAAKRAKPSL